jgi:diguanylate cyclase (GGDEF)-like protein
MDVTGRIGGDEFLVFMNNITESDAGRLAGKIEDQVQHAFDGEEFGGEVSMSIGIASFPANGTDFETLYNNADKALYAVKKGGKASYGIYSDDLDR